MNFDPVLEAKFPELFSEYFGVRDCAFSTVVRQIHFARRNAPSMMLLLEFVWRNKGQNVPLDTAKKVIEILKLLAVYGIDPSFFAKTSASKIVLDILAQHGIQELHDAIEDLFLKFSQAICLYMQLGDNRIKCFMEENMECVSIATLNMFIPVDDRSLLSEGQALCFNVLLWELYCGALALRALRKVWRTGLVKFSNKDKVLEKAKDTRDVLLCMGACELLSTLLTNPFLMEYHHSLLVESPYRVIRIFGTADSALSVPDDKMMKENVKASMSALQKLRKILQQCDFDPSLEFFNSVSEAILALDFTQVDELVKTVYDIFTLNLLP
nr:hypothetical protein CFP56_65065 [Quercus suber]POE90394.1 hypothetical protein CFP56_76443 [Quercus suber]